MPVLLIVGPKRTLAASHAADCCPLVSHGGIGGYADGTQTDGRQTVTLCFPLGVDNHGDTTCNVRSLGAAKRFRTPYNVHSNV